MANPSFLPFPPIGKHGVIGDRRTAAMVAADGTIDWWCLPDFDDEVICGALLDGARGGFCRFGPRVPELGTQRYEDTSVCLETRWDGLELVDFMPWPERERSEEVREKRVILRRLRATGGGAVRARFELRPRGTFEEAPRVSRVEGGVRFGFRERAIALWTSFPVETDAEGSVADFRLEDGEEAWVMIGLEETPAEWDVTRCAELHRRTIAYWHDWAGELNEFSHTNGELRRCAMTVHLLAHAPNDAVVAAVTTSLPERIGGDKNYDYRYTWVRDASIAAAFLATMGQPREVARYFDWLCKLDSETDAPLQVCYRTNGVTELAERKVPGISGYRGSLPVRFGNRAYNQRQLGSLGWFADSALIFLEEGGGWKPEFWELLRRTADYVCGAWHQPDSGVWELPDEAQFVSSKVMGWVTLDRALRIAELTGESAPRKWAAARAEIHAEVLEKGWSAGRGIFRQRYDSEALDAAALLIPMMNFLPTDDPRVLSTLDAIERELVIGGLVHRFDPQATLGKDELPIGEFEGAFLPATFWYAHALAGAGRIGRAKEIIRECESLVTCPGIFAEEADARTKQFLGNTPLLFSQVEYGRALLAIHRHSHPQTSKTL